MHNKVTHAVSLGLLALQLVTTPPAKAQAAPLGGRTGLVTSTALPSPDTTGQNLVYKPPVSPLRIAELAQLQRKKLEEDYFRRAGFTTVLAPSVKASSSKPHAQPVRARTAHTLGLVATYGLPKSQQAELRLNGITSTVSANALIGPAKVESIMPGQIRLTLRPPGRVALATQTLRPGEQLEWFE
jgi:hypothetical protein